ncbi:MAG: HAD-IC family P-type ATPase [Limnochordia bacterium]|nr:HAD-IC family P-type ATPase [Limnochordia bacterium]
MVMAAAASAELRFEHHLATAMMAKAQADEVEPLPATDWDLRPGQGVFSFNRGQLQAAVGNETLMAELGVMLSPDRKELLAFRESKGETVTLVAMGTEVIGLIGIADEPRPDAWESIAALRSGGIDPIFMLTGDNERAAIYIDDAVGIREEEIHAGLMPDEKVNVLRTVQANGTRVAMVGDGINDAPALTTADVSIAMGTPATRAAMEAAVLVLMGNSLLRIPKAITHAQKNSPGGEAERNPCSSRCYVPPAEGTRKQSKLGLWSGITRSKHYAVTLNGIGIRLLKRPSTH